MSDECCAHLRVAYKPIDNGDGSMRERWQCEACGLAFKPYRGEHVTPGLPARHMIVRDACRETHGDQGAVSEALAAIESEARKIIGAWPAGQGHQFHFVLTVERATTTSDVCPVCEGDDPFCPTCGGETGRRRRRTATDDSTPAPAYKPLRDALEAQRAAPETVAYHRQVKGATGAKGSDALRLDVVVALDGGGTAHETITTVECPACGGTGDADRNANERAWNKCELCDGDGRVPEAVGAAHERGSS